MGTALLDRIRQGHHRLLDLLADLEPADLRAASRLPGWSRGHVVAHLAHNARALANVSEAALRGELVEAYPDGDRNEAIERDAGLEVIELVRLLTTADAQLEIVWDSLAEGDRQRPVRFWESTVHDLLLCRWRENEIHSIDLVLSCTERDWTPDFCEHAIDFLAPRLAGTGVTVAPDGLDRSWSFGVGSQPTVHGDAASIACWMAGREPGRFPDCDGPLPELGPWP